MGADDQLSLFTNVAAGPAGLQYQPEFISLDEQADLIAHAAGLPFERFQFGIYEGKRRVVYFGARYDFTHQRLEAVDALPDWLLPYARRTEAFAGLTPGSIRHAMFTEYSVGAGIGWHRDKKEFDAVFGLSLAAPCKFRFRRRSGATWERYTLDCAPCSLYAMRGDARSVWEHSIPEVDQLRYSITFRTMVG